MQEDANSVNSTPEQARDIWIYTRYLGNIHKLRRDKEVEVEFCCKFYGDFASAQVPLRMIAALLGRAEGDVTPLDLDLLIGSRPADTIGWAEALRVSGVPQIGDAENLYIVDVNPFFYS